MTHPLHRYACLTIDRFLEWKDHEHTVGDLTHRFHPAAAPGPELRRDVVDDRHAQATDGARETEIEVRKVDGDEHVGTIGPRLLHEAAICGVGPRQEAKHLEQSGDR